MPEDKIDIEKEYNSLKHKLPDFKRLDDEFELSNIQIENKKFLLRFIRRKINEKIIFFCRIIESILYPTQPNIITVVESKVFTDEEKQEISNIYKKLMHYEKESINLDVDEDEDLTAKYINDVIRIWPEIKKEIHKMTKKMQNAWSEEEIPAEKNSYTF